MWNLFANGEQIMHAADCKKLAESPEGDFRHSEALLEDRAFSYYCLWSNIQRDSISCSLTQGFSRSGDTKDLILFSRYSSVVR